MDRVIGLGDRLDRDRPGRPMAGGDLPARESVRSDAADGTTPATAGGDSGRPAACRPTERHRRGPDSGSRPGSAGQGRVHCARGGGDHVHGQGPGVDDQARHRPGHAGGTADSDKTPHLIRIPFDAPYLDAKALLLQTVAEQTRCRSVHHPQAGDVRRDRLLRPTWRTNRSPTSSRSGSVTWFRGRSGVATIHSALPGVSWPGTPRPDLRRGVRLKPAPSARASYRSAVEARTTSSGWSRTWRCSGSRPSSTLNSRSAATMPIRRCGRTNEVRGTESCAVNGMSS